MFSTISAYQSLSQFTLISLRAGSRGRYCVKEAKGLSITEGLKVSRLDPA